MIVVYHQTTDGHPEAVLCYDGETEEIWGLDRPWTASLDLVGLNEQAFAAAFDKPGYNARLTDRDPFEDDDTPEAFLRNYPPGSESIPDVSTRAPEDRETADTISRFSRFATYEVDGRRLNGNQVGYSLMHGHIDPSEDDVTLVEAPPEADDTFGPGDWNS